MDNNDKVNEILETEMLADVEADLAELLALVPPTYRERFAKSNPMMVPWGKAVEHAERTRDGLRRWQQAMEKG